MNVSELIEILKGLPQDAEVFGAWEGQDDCGVQVFTTPDGRVLLDVEMGMTSNHIKGSVEHGHSP